MAVIPVCDARAELSTHTFHFRGQTYAYALSLPEGYSSHADQPWPLILYLHGAGKSGEDGLLPTRSGIYKAVEGNPTLYPAIVLIPQLKEHMYWSDQISLDFALALLDEVKTHHLVDENRIYLSGASEGALGSWRLAMHRPKLFAALVTVASPFIMLLRNDELRVFGGEGSQLPIWISNSKGDGSIPYKRAGAVYRKLLELRRVSSSPRLVLKEYEDFNHSQICTEAYKDPEMAEWLLTQKRRRAP